MGLIFSRCNAKPTSPVQEEVETLDTVAAAQHIETDDGYWGAEQISELPIIIKPREPVDAKKGNVIGTGAFGKVYLGLNNSTGGLCAIKEVSLLGELDDTSVNELEQEIAVLRCLEHPNIVSYLGTSRDDEVLNIYLEYVSGGSLTHLLKKFGRFREPIIVKYTTQILKGLEYLHRHGIVHRDIKGANILVDNSGAVKLADFGASKIMRGMATMGAMSLRGTPFFMAPEVVAQKGHGRKADIWALGCTVIEMATGRPPWADFGEAVTVMFAIAKSTEPPPLPDLTPEGKSFLLACFERNVVKRPTATALLKHPFITGKSPSQPTISLPPPDERTSSPPRTSRSIKSDRSTSSRSYRSDHPMLQTGHTAPPPTPPAPLQPASMPGTPASPPPSPKNPDYNSRRSIQSPSSPQLSVTSPARGAPWTPTSPAWTKRRKGSVSPKHPVFDAFADGSVGDISPTSPAMPSLMPITQLHPQPVNILPSPRTPESRQGIARYQSLTIAVPNEPVVPVVPGRAVAATGGDSVPSSPGDSVRGRRPRSHTVNSRDGAAARSHTPSDEDVELIDEPPTSWRRFGADNEVRRLQRGDSGSRVWSLEVGMARGRQRHSPPSPVFGGAPPTMSRSTGSGLNLTQGLNLSAASMQSSMVTPSLSVGLNNSEPLSPLPHVTEQ